jgi:hypothetical protein
MEEAELFLMGVEDEANAEINQEWKAEEKAREEELKHLYASQYDDDNTDIIITNKVKVKTSLYDNGVDLFIERNTIGREMVYTIE